MTLPNATPHHGDDGQCRGDVLDRTKTPPPLRRIGVNRRPLRSFHSCRSARLICGAAAGAMSGLVRRRVYLANLLAGAIAVQRHRRAQLRSGVRQRAAAIHLPHDHRSQDNARPAQRPDFVCRARRDRQRFLAAVRPLPAVGAHLFFASQLVPRFGLPVSSRPARGPVRVVPARSQLMEKRHG